jgi:hypothetical protein
MQNKSRNQDSMKIMQTHERKVGNHKHIAKQSKAMVERERERPLYLYFRGVFIQEA